MMIPTDYRGLEGLQGLGDWFTASCQPGTPGCVPHWYCYIPGMATPDCWASFVQGTKELATIPGQAAGQVAGAVVSGAVEGVGEGLLGGGGPGKPPGLFPAIPTWVYAVGIGVAGLLVYSATRPVGR